jgi:beta-lactam-binding protein with PASTA domain
VTIVVAKAPASVTVPPVVGDKAAAAFGALTAEGFEVDRTFRAVTHANRAGSVVSQSPGSGAKRAKGSTVSIVVGTYAGPTPPTSSSASSSSSGSATTPAPPSSTSSSGSTSGTSTSATSTTP